MKKVIVSDYDQTFYINDHDVEKNKIAIKEFMNKGNLFIIATGRSYMDFKNKIDEYDIKYDYAIINHGATTLNNKDEIMDNFLIDNAVIQNIKKDIRLDKALTYFCCSTLESRVDFEHENLSKINARYETKENAMEINYIINKKYSKYVHSYYVTKESVEIISNRASKADAIKVLIDRLGIEPKNVYTIGDGYSDIEMVKKFNGYCMQGSVKELKEVAKKEYRSVSDLIKEILGENDDI